MSAAAEQAVQVFSHPKVKGSVRALLEQIAKQIPEGQTMTAPVAMDALAAPAGYETRTMWHACDVLLELGAIRMVDRRRGRTARYELLELPGAGVDDPSLPLRADLHAVPTRTPSELGPLFTPATIADRTPEVGRTPSDLFSYVWSVNLRSFFICWLPTYDLFSYLRVCRRRTYDLFSYLWSRTYEFFSYVRSPLDVDDARARDVHTSKNVHTHAAAPDTGPPATADESRPPPIRHPWHAWCGQVCVPKHFHDALVAKGHDAGWLVAFYARTCAPLTEDQVRRGAVDEFKFWRTALKAGLVQLETAREPPPAQAKPAYDAVWRQILERLETKVNRHTFHTWFLPLVLVADTGTLIEVTKRGPQSGLFAAWIHKHYDDVLRAAVEEVRPGARVHVIDVWAIESQVG
jgi:hypothetical protein